MILLGTIAGARAFAEDASPESPSPPPGVTVLLREGDKPNGGGGLPVSWLGSPVTNDAGEVAFTGKLDDGDKGDGFVWRDGAIIWRHSQAPPPRPTAISPSMGFATGGQFVFRTLVDQLDTIWSHLGPVLAKNQPAPGLGNGATIMLSRRATMTSGGRAHWVSEFRDGPGENGKGRVLYAADDAAPDKIHVLLRSDQVVGDLRIARPRGLAFNYQVSSNGAHVIQPVELVANASSDHGLYVDGAIAHREGEVVGRSASWATFRQVAINDQGDYLFSAETAVSTGAQTLVIAYNGRVVAREGGELGGYPLTRPAEVLALAIDNRGRAAHLWSLAGFGAEALFFACDAADLQHSSLLLTGSLAVTPTAFSIRRFEHVGHGPAISLSADSDTLFAVVALGREEPQHAILEVELPACPDDDEITASEGQAIAAGPGDSDAGEQSSDSPTRPDPLTVDQP